MTTMMAVVVMLMLMMQFKKGQKQGAAVNEIGAPMGSGEPRPHHTQTRKDMDGCRVSCG
jgi:hypothetical protein